MNQSIVFPAEWYPQDAILITWPHQESAWSESLDEVEQTYFDLLTSLSHYQDVIIQLHSSIDVDRLLAQLAINEANLSRTHFVLCNSNDTWTRDHGPITVLKDGIPSILNFKFNGWGNKFEHALDTLLNTELQHKGVLKDLQDIDWVLEGGSIESDGAGTLMTTTQCLLNENRNGSVSKEELTQRIKNWFSSSQILWLENGFLEGDDTDAHIDTLARFAPNNQIVFQDCADTEDSHYEPLNAMKAELEKFKNLNGQPYKLVGLPLPKPKYATDGHRLPATYANFLITNKVVLVPTYQDANDQVAIDMLEDVFEDHIVKGINALPLIEEHGSLHCITMQLVRGSVDFSADFLNVNARAG